MSFPDEMIERFLAKFEPQPSGCWEWIAYITPAGYGQFTPHWKTNVGAHRFSHELFVGPILEGLQIDHLCRNTRCVNPDHLEAVTPLVNQQRGLKAMQTHCLRGHPLDEKNTYRNPQSGTRSCRICRRAAKQRFLERQAS